MHTNYIFSGFGYYAGKYKITNKDISEAIDKGFLQGFSKDKLSKSLNYQEYLKDNPKSTPFDYFAGFKMGFYERHHVTPFPPTAKKLYYAETSLDLGVKAIKNALKDACISAGEIDSWMISTVSPHEQAPGIAATIKSYFVDFENTSPTVSLASGCAGFNINLERAIDFLKAHPEAKNVVVAHTETMSSFLMRRIKFVPFVTFGDAAAAVIVSRSEDEEKYGIQSIQNSHDLKMLDYVGVNSNWDLYMDDTIIKDRAIVNLSKTSIECLKQSDWDVEDIDKFVPHQTGNVILKPSAEEIGIDLNKVFLQGQNKFGNVSGSTVPLSLALLHEQEELYDGMKILSATAGVGGNYGTFSYIVKKQNKIENFNFHNEELKGKTALILGASGNLGYNLAKELSSRGCNLILHANNNLDKLKEFNNAKALQCDFLSDNSLDKFILELKKLGNIDYFVNLSGCADCTNTFKVNFNSPVQIINAIHPQIKQTIFNMGTAIEDNHYPQFDEWISANRALHGYLASSSGEFLKKGIRIVYLQSGIIEKGLSDCFDKKYKFKLMLSIGQATSLKTSKICYNVANSLYLPKVLRVQYSYENAMLLGRMGYKLEVDI